MSKTYPKKQCAAESTQNELITLPPQTCSCGKKNQNGLCSSETIKSIGFAAVVAFASRLKRAVTLPLTNTQQLQLMINKMMTAAGISGLFRCRWSNNILIKVIFRDDCELYAGISCIPGQAMRCFVLISWALAPTKLLSIFVLFCY